MGGIGSGGRRPGSGRKRADTNLRSIQGGRARTPPVVPPTTNPISPVEEFDAPDDLEHDERAVWLKLAPHAFKARTLTRATALSFEMLCRNYVLMRSVGKSDPGGSPHRGLIQRVDAELLRFNLSPCGKAMYEAEPQAPANPLSKFLSGRKV